MCTYNIHTRTHICVCVIYACVWGEGGTMFMSYVNNNKCKNGI